MTMPFDRQPRIAIISEHASPLAVLGSEDAGGQNVYVAEVSRHLAEIGYEVDVFTRLDRPSIELVREWVPGVRVIHLPAGPRSFLKKDAMWPHMSEFRDAMLRFVRGEGLSYQLVHTNFWMSGWVGCELKPLLGAPLVQIFHALGQVKRLHQGEADTSPNERYAVEQRIIRAADRIIAQCPAEVVELETLYAAPTGHVRVVPSAVNSQLFAPVSRDAARALAGVSLDEKVIVYVGRMLPRKGIDNLVRAAARLIKRSALPIRVLLVGGETAEPDPVATPEIARLSQLARDLDILDRVTFTGKREQRFLKYYYSAADVCVTTPWYEPYGLTPLEAMACGRPVIGSAVGGITFTVSDGEAGFLVPPRDDEALADRLERVLSNPALQTAMGAAARRRVETIFTWRRVAEQTVVVYQELLGAPSTRQVGAPRAGRQGGV